MMAFINLYCEDALSFIWNDGDADVESQFAMVWAGYRTVRKFVSLEDSKALVRKACKDDIGITDPSQVGAMVACWDTAQRADENEKSQKLLAANTNAPRPMPMNEFTLMKKALERALGVPEDQSLSDSQIPHPTQFFNHKLEEVEKGFPVATPLDEIMFTGEPDTGGITEVGADSAGMMRMMFKKVKGTTARTEEEYRAKMKLEGAAWQMLSSKFLSRPWLKAIARSDFVSFSEWILGEDVFIIKMGTPQGERRIKAPWNILMNFEISARQAAFKHINERGHTMKVALNMVQGDADLRLRNFTTPLTMHLADKSKNNTPPPQNLWYERPTKYHKGDKGKGKGKGNKDRDQKGKGKGKSKDQNPLKLHKVGGREICYTYNAGKKCEGGCNRLHVCQFKPCAEKGEKHPMSICEKAQAAGVR